MCPKTFRLNLSPADNDRLQTLQFAFVEAFNHTFSLVVNHRCWNRVALHHFAYRTIRQKFPDLGSQLACNVIYFVSKTAKSIYQDPKSPYHIKKFGWEKPPTLKFPANSPVVLDRNTLSIKNSFASIFTLDGRIRFQLGTSVEIEKQLAQEKIKEILLYRDKKGFLMKFN